MDPLTPTDLQTLRTTLVARLKELGAEFEAVEQARVEGITDAADSVVDQKDLASQWQTAELVGDVEERNVGEARLVTAALRRMDQGSYGACEDCGATIGLPRLHVQPAALRCVACQSSHEARG